MSDKKLDDCFIEAQKVAIKYLAQSDCKIDQEYSRRLSLALVQHKQAKEEAEKIKDYNIIDLKCLESSMILVYKANADEPKNQIIDYFVNFTDEESLYGWEVITHQSYFRDSFYRLPEGFYYNAVILDNETGIEENIDGLPLASLKYEGSHYSYKGNKVLSIQFDKKQENWVYKHEIY